MLLTRHYERHRPLQGLSMLTNSQPKPSTSVFFSRNLYQLTYVTNLMCNNVVKIFDTFIRSARNQWLWKTDYSAPIGKYFFIFMLLKYFRFSRWEPKFPEIYFTLETSDEYITTLLTFTETVLFKSWIILNSY